ncbi:O-antigen polymerase [Metabacillus bambusae]|uniref:Oligosaccharide repeat unit polymerase n=1 Tax=Metabacillus bambusae TaxID=2795218 RepID=A0ABS3N146_9BACI|nr:O-antigen polymerase [Metabacillus bambusae]MBO1511894.1 oligosaccharide repeat unit polymerase [Metabacillus bambusae]
MNPFSIYTLVFAFVCIIYNFGWSNQLSELSYELIIFLLFTMLVMTILSFVTSKLFSYNFYKIEDTIGVKTNIKILLGLTLVQVLLQRDIPLYMISVHSIDNHGTYGTPIVLPIIMTYSTFLGIYLFHLILSGNKKRKEYIILFLLSFVPSILFYYRGTATITILSCAIMYIFYIKDYLRINRIVKIGILLLVAIYLFGFIGNLRLPEGQDILVLGDASGVFISSGIPSEFFLVYMYLASPLANLELNIGGFTSLDNFSLFYLSEIVPNIVSEHILSYMGESRVQIDRVLHAFTVGTIYARAFEYLRWHGVVFLFVHLVIYIFGFLLLLKKCKEFYLTGLCILSCASLLSVFSNMLIETSIVIPLLFCIFFYFIKKIRF